MPSREKKLAKIKQNTKDVSFNEIDSLLKAYGFSHRNTGGSHNIYCHDQLSDIQDWVNIPYKKPIKEVYIKKAIKIIEKLIAE